MEILVFRVLIYLNQVMISIVLAAIYLHYSHPQYLYFCIINLVKFQPCGLITEISISSNVSFAVALSGFRILNRKLFHQPWWIATHDTFDICENNTWKLTSLLLINFNFEFASMFWKIGGFNFLQDYFTLNLFQFSTPISSSYSFDS